MNNSTFVKGGENSQASRLITAINKSLDMFTTEPKGMFGRKAVIQSGNVTINSEEIDFEFEVPFDDDTEANECEIKIYNLTQTTINQFKYDRNITITAGYKGDTGVIFSGYISKVYTKTEGVDKVTTIYALDDMDLKERDIVDVTFSAGTRASYILSNLISRISLPLAVFSIKRDWIYKDEVKIDGGLMSNVKKYAEVCGISVYINKGKIYARHISEGDNINFTVSNDTGMIESPEEFEEEITAEDYNDTVKGYKVKMLLQHRMNTAAIINLSSVNYSGQYRVRKGKHTFNQDDFFTDIEAVTITNAAEKIDLSSVGETNNATITDTSTMDYSNMDFGDMSNMDMDELMNSMDIEIPTVYSSKKNTGGKNPLLFTVNEVK